MKKRKSKELKDFRKKFLEDLKETLERWRKEDEEYWQKQPPEIRKAHEEVLKELEKEERRKEKMEKKFLESLSSEQKKRRRKIMKVLDELFSISVSEGTPEQERIERGKLANKLLEKLLKMFSVEEITEVLTSEERKRFLDRYRRYKKGGFAYGINILF